MHRAPPTTGRCPALTGLGNCSKASGQSPFRADGRECYLGCPATAGYIISCRDLIIRNFKSTYGDLDVHVDASGLVIKTVFHV